jgi:hypothetical protein
MKKNSFKVKKSPKFLRISPLFTDGVAKRIGNVRVYLYSEFTSIMDSNIAQFNNSTVFTGSQHPNSIGNAIRLCLEFNIILVSHLQEKPAFKSKSKNTMDDSKKVYGNDLK